MERIISTADVLCIEILQTFSGLWKGSVWVTLLHIAFASLFHLLLTSLPLQLHLISLVLGVSSFLEPEAFNILFLFWLNVIFSFLAFSEDFN
jgi:hypothetical protein